MLNPRTLGFPDEDSVTSPQMKRPAFGKKKPVDPTSTPPMTDHTTMGVAGNPGGHPANVHLQHAIGAADPHQKQKHVFKALSAIRKAALLK